MKRLMKNVRNGEEDIRQFDEYLTTMSNCQIVSLSQWWRTFEHCEWRQQDIENDGAFFEMWKTVSGWLRVVQHTD